MYNYLLMGIFSDLEDGQKLLLLAFVVAIIYVSFKGKSNGKGNGGNKGGGSNSGNTGGTV